MFGKPTPSLFGATGNTSFGKPLFRSLLCFISKIGTFILIQAQIHLEHQTMQPSEEVVTHIMILIVIFVFLKFLHTSSIVCMWHVFIKFIHRLINSEVLN